MGFHLCEWCFDPGIGGYIIPEGVNHAFNFSSSGDVTLYFENGHIWEMPDMILHYVADHGWQPPADFISDVMTQRFLGGERVQTKSVDWPKQVGYLHLELVKGPVPENFVSKLQGLMKIATENGDRIQYRGTI